MNKILLILGLFIFACSTNDRLEEALVMSGANRVALEKVLAHYSKDEAENVGILGDNNDIYPNNIYELMYYDKEGWVSMGRKTATDYFIECDNVPSGALYWLRNLTIGKEEHIFTYENEKARFW